MEDDDPLDMENNRAENLNDDADPEIVIANPGVAAEGAEGVNVVDPADRPEGERVAEVEGDDRLTPEQVRILIDKARQDEKARIDKELAIDRAHLEDTIKRLDKEQDAKVDALARSLVQQEVDQALKLEREAFARQKQELLDRQMAELAAIKADQKRARQGPAAGGERHQLQQGSTRSGPEVDHAEEAARLVRTSRTSILRNPRGYPETKYKAPMSEQDRGYSPSFERRGSVVDTSQPPPNLIPTDDWGQNRAFMAASDPRLATTPAQVGDMGTVGLQMLRIMRKSQNMDPAVLRDIDNLAEVMRSVVAASEATRTREKVATELQPLTKVPEKWGHNSQIANIRLYNVPNFSGTSSDTIDVSSWLDRLFSLGSAHSLTAGAVINLMVMAATGTAADYIRQLRDEDKTPYQITQALELRYGDLCLPEEARSKCNSLPRKEKEKLVDFIDRLRKMAKMATRNIPDKLEKLEQIDLLVRSNIRRALPISVKRLLDDRVRYYQLMGLKEMSCRDYEKECIELERSRDERREEVAAATKPTKVQHLPVQKKYVRQAQVRAAYEEEDDPFSDEEEILSNPSDEEEEDEEALHWCRRMEQAKRHYAAKGQKVTPEQLRRRVTQKFNQERRGFQRKPLAPRAAAAAAQMQNWRGPPERLDNDRRRNIGELLALANAERGECIQCGTPGHIMGRDECALRNRPLTDRPCAKCGKGLHSADDCLRGFSSQFKGKPEPINNANAALEESDDDLNQE